MQTSYKQPEFKHDGKLAFLLLICIVLLYFLCSSCNPVKQVLKDEAKKELVGREWEKTNPCVNDTVLKRDTTFLPGKPIPVESKPVIITNTKNRAIDTTFKSGLKIKLDTLGNLSVYEPTIKAPDTVKIETKAAVTDNRRLGLARDSLNKAFKRIDSLGIELEKQKTKVLEAIKEKEKMQGQTKSLAVTFKWFINNLWDTVKWWLLIAALCGLLWKFRSPVLSLFSKLIK